MRIVVPGGAVRVSKAVPAVSRPRVRRLSAAAGLARARRMGVRAADVSGGGVRVRPARRVRPGRLAPGLRELDYRLSPVGPASGDGDAAADADPREVGGAAGECRGWRSVRLAVAVRGRGRALAMGRKAGGGPAGVP